MAQAHELVITAVGPDRKGLAADLTSHIHRAGANLADARMINLRGRFAIVALVEGPQETVERARQSLVAASGALGVRLEFSEGRAEERATGVAYRLKTYSMDQPGIVHKFTSLLREHHANIEELETRLESAPFMGTPVFTMEILLNVPPGTSLKSLRRALQELADGMNADVDLDRA